MTNRWTFEVIAPAGEAVELKHLLPHVQHWRGMRQVGLGGRRWALDNGPIELVYDGESQRGDLCNRIVCTATLQWPVSGCERVLKFAQWAAKELTWDIRYPAGFAD